MALSLKLWGLRCCYIVDQKYWKSKVHHDFVEIVNGSSALTKAILGTAFTYRVFQELSFTWKFQEFQYVQPTAEGAEMN